MSAHSIAASVTAGKKLIYPVVADGIKGVVIGNESGLTCVVTMEGGGVQKTLYPSIIDWYQVRKGFTGNIIVEPSAVLSNAATFPSTDIFFDVIGINDVEEAANYPISLSRNTNLGNQTPVGSSTSVINDNQALTPSNVFVEATPSSAPGSTVSIATDGTMTIKGDVANVLTTLLQLIPGAAANASSVILSDAARATEILGSLLVDSGLFGVAAKGDTIDASASGLNLKSKGGDMVGEQGSTEIWRVNNIGQYYHSLGGPAIQTFNPAGAGGQGTVVIYQPFSGTGFKLILVKFNGSFKNGNATLNVTLQNPFTAFAWYALAEAPGFSFVSGGSNQNADIISAWGNPSTILTGVTSINQLGSIGTVLHAFDTLAFAASGVTGRNGTILAIGI